MVFNHHDPGDGSFARRIRANRIAEGYRALFLSNQRGRPIGGYHLFLREGPAHAAAVSYRDGVACRGGRRAGRGSDVHSGRLSHEHADLQPADFPKHPLRNTHVL